MNIVHSLLLCDASFSLDFALPAESLLESDLDEDKCGTKCLGSVLEAPVSLLNWKYDLMVES